MSILVEQITYSDHSDTQKIDDLKHEIDIFKNMMSDLKGNPMYSEDPDFNEEIGLVDSRYNEFITECEMCIDDLIERNNNLVSTLVSGNLDYDYRFRKCLC
jgi:hypothetical protein